MKSYFIFLKRNKAYAIIDVLGLALSMMFVVLIGAYTWQESHVDTQHSKADRMYFLGLDMDGKKFLGSNWRVQPILREKFPEIESSTAIYRHNRTLEYNDEKFNTNIYLVDSTFYDIFDFELIAGDRNTVLDDPNSVVITEAYARRVFGDENPIGKSMQFQKGEDPVIIAGIMAPMENTALTMLDHTAPDMLVDFSKIRFINSSMYGEEMGNAIGADVVLLTREPIDHIRKAAEYEKGLKDHYWILNLPEDKIRLELLPFKDAYFSEITSAVGNMNNGNLSMLRLLFIAGTVVLVFALMNYINLTVALSTRRAKEMATKRLLGESRTGIIMQLVGESTLLCFVSFAIGFGLALLAEPYASALLDVPVNIIGCLNIVTIGFLIGTILLTGIIAGIAPAWIISSVKPIEIVNGTFRRKNSMVFSKIFIVIQNVVTIVMIASALTINMQVRHLINAPLGYETKGIIRLWSPPNHQLFVEKVRQLPCVEAVSSCWLSPFDGGNNYTMTHDGRTISFQVFYADSAYMKLLGLELERDNHTTSAVKHYINRQALAELGLADDATTFPFNDETLEVSGILKDFKIRDVLAEQHPVQIVIGEAGKDFGPWTILIKVTGDETQALDQIKELYIELNESSYSDDIFENCFIEQQIAEQYHLEYNLSVIIFIFAVIAVVISMLGLVAMSSYYVQQRAREIAIRKVMGSTSAEVLSRLVRSFLIYVVAAFVVAIPIIYYLMNRWLADYSYRIEVYWWIYAVSGFCCIIISLLAVYFQSRRAANSNPIKSLYQN